MRALRENRLGLFPIASNARPQTLTPPKLIFLQVSTWQWFGFSLSGTEALNGGFPETGTFQKSPSPAQLFWCFSRLDTYFIAGLNIWLLPCIQHGWKLSHQPKKLLGNTWYYDRFPVEWRKGKTWGKGRWVNPCTHSQEGFSSTATALPGNLSPQESTQHPNLTRWLPLLITQRQLTGTALNRAAAPCSHLPGQHHPWLMQSRWKSFLIQQLLTSLSWETQPGASPQSAHSYFEVGAGLASCAEQHGDGVSGQLSNAVLQAVKPKEGLRVREGAQRMGAIGSTQVRDLQMLPPATSFMMSVCPKYELLRESDPTLLSCILRGLLATLNCCHRPPSVLGTALIQNPGRSSALQTVWCANMGWRQWMAAEEGKSYSGKIWGESGSFKRGCTTRDWPQSQKVRTEYYSSSCPFSHYAQSNSKARVEAEITCWWKTRTNSLEKHGISLDKILCEMEHSHCIYPLNPTALQLKRHLPGRGCCCLIALMPTAGLAVAGSLKLHFKWLSGRQCQTFAEDVLRRKKQRLSPPHFYGNKTIFDLYRVYMLHKNANYSPKAESE